MKAKREKKEFKPITITIETKEEAEHLWHLLNCGTGKSMGEYKKEEKIEFDTYLKDEMWRTFNLIFNENDFE